MSGLAVQALDREMKPSLPPHVRLQFDPVRQRYCVLAPERVFWPDDVALAILRKCNGTRTIAEIAECLAAEYAAPLETIKADVLEFTKSWVNQRLLRV